MMILLERFELQRISQTLKGKNINCFQCFELSVSIHFCDISGHRFRFEYLSEME